jgi:hypothetical protein
VIYLSSSSKCQVVYLSFFSTVLLQVSSGLPFFLLHSPSPSTQWSIPLFLLSGRAYLSVTFGCRVLSIRRA